MLTYCLELELIASLDRDIIKDEAKAVRYIADTIRNLGYPSATFLPLFTRERPDVEKQPCEATSNLLKFIKQHLYVENVSKVRQHTLHCFFFVTNSIIQNSTLHYSLWNVCLDVTSLEETSSMEEDTSTDDEEKFGAELVLPIFYDNQTYNRQIIYILSRNKNFSSELPDDKPKHRSPIGISMWHFSIARATHFP